MIAAIIVAGGSGSRMGSSRPKQFLHLDHVPILTRTLQAFDNCSLIESIILVLPEAERHYFDTALLPDAGLSSVLTIVSGGERRQESVVNGLAAIPDTQGLALIHDGVRPMVSAGLIEAVVRGARRWGACIPVVQATDTLKQVDENGLVNGTLPRQTVRLAQTPQGFRLSIIRQAHEKAMACGMRATDDASLVEALGHPVHIVEGEPKNIKITTPEDLAVASAYLKSP